MGFLKTLQRLCREYHPSRVYVVWEGGGSQRRRKLYSDYKLNRKPERLNRFYEDDIPDSEENKKHQLVTLLSMVKTIPVCQVYVSDCEGDDVVSFLCRSTLKDKEKIIVSSDKDMYQLLDDATRIYSLHRKKIVTKEDVFEEFRVKSHNFALAKCLCGDPSDNIPGVKGIGFKGVAKRFPMLGSDETIMLQDVIDFSASHVNESVLYKRVVESVEDVRRNWQLIHLDGSMLSAEQARRVEHVVNTFAPSVNRMAFMKLLAKEGISDFDPECFFYDMACVEGFRRLEKQE